MKKFFNSLISGQDNSVSFGRVFAVLFMVCWLFHFMWINFHLLLVLKISSAEALILAGGLYAIGKGMDTIQGFQNK